MFHVLLGLSEPDSLHPCIHEKCCYTIQLDAYGDAVTSLTSTLRRYQPAWGPYGFDVTAAAPPGTYPVCVSGDNDYIYSAAVAGLLYGHDLRSGRARLPGRLGRCLPGAPAAVGRHPTIDAARPGTGGRRAPAITHKGVL